MWRTFEDDGVGDPAMDVAVDLGDSTITLVDSRGQSETSELPVVPDVAGDTLSPSRRSSRTGDQPGRA